MSKIEYCHLCNQSIPYSSGQFTRWHLNKIHKIDSKEYYDKFLKKEGDGICVTCGKSTKFNTFTKGYFKHCSVECVGPDPNVQQKSITTSLQKYGTKYAVQSKEYRKKAESVLLNKYGVINVGQLPEIKAKVIKTMLERYGYANANQVPEFQEKAKHTIFKKYGVYFISESPIIKEQRRQTCLIRYGVDSYSKSDEYRKRQEEAGLWIKLEDKSDFEKYRKNVERETNKHINVLFEKWNGKCYYTNEILITDSNYYNDPLYATIDHKRSIFNGFKNNIDPKIIGNIDNLCLCARVINSQKGLKNENDFILWLHT